MNTAEEFTPVMIKCPSCDTVQAAIVEHTVPFGTYIHHCEKCKYVIMESEWDLVKPFETSTPTEDIEKEARHIAIDYLCFKILCEQGYYDEKGEFINDVTTTAPIVTSLTEAGKLIRSKEGTQLFTFLKNRLRHLLSHLSKENDLVEREDNVTGDNATSEVPCDAPVNCGNSDEQ